jgi:hypothetical protein
LLRSNNTILIDEVKISECNLSKNNIKALRYVEKEKLFWAVGFEKNLMKSSDLS